MKISGFEGSNLKVLEHLGFRIMELRREAKMSQLDLALRAGMSKNYLCDLEHGRRNPSGGSPDFHSGQDEGNAVHASDPFRMMPSGSGIPPRKGENE